MSSSIDWIFAAWDSTADMARDLEVDYFTVRQWKARERIPAWHLERVAEAYTKRSKKKFDYQKAIAA